MVIKENLVEILENYGDPEENNNNFYPSNTFKLKND